MFPLSFGHFRIGYQRKVVVQKHGLIFIHNSNFSICNQYFQCYFTLMTEYNINLYLIGCQIINQEKWNICFYLNTAPLFFHMTMILDEMFSGKLALNMKRFLAISRTGIYRRLMESPEKNLVLVNSLNMENVYEYPRIIPRKYRNASHVIGDRTCYSTM